MPGSWRGLYHTDLQPGAALQNTAAGNCDSPGHAGGLVSERRRSAEHPVEMPPVGDAFQLVLTGIFELQP